MRNQTLIPLVAAGACGLVAVLGIQQYLAAKGEKEVVETVKVLVAATPIDTGVRLDELNTKFITVEKATAPEGAVTSMEEVDQRSLRIARGPNDWILLEQLGERGNVGASIKIPPGMRVATIPVDATTNHSGMLRPGNRIDLLLSYKWKDPDTKLTTMRVRPLLEYIEVFAVGNEVYGVSKTGDNNKARNISLLVDTEQMLMLQLSQDKGSLSTVLRSNDDKEELNVAEMSEDYLDGSSRTVLNDVSSLGFFDNLKEPVNEFAMPAETNDSKTEQPQLMAHVEEVAKPQYWTMTIHEGGSRRREKVNLDSEQPLYDPAAYSPPTSGPASAGMKAGGPGGPRTGPVGMLPDGLDFGDTDLDDLASELLELLN